MQAGMYVHIIMYVCMANYQKKKNWQLAQSNFGSSALEVLGDRRPCDHHTVFNLNIYVS